jgi:hypothetical protein
MRIQIVNGTNHDLKLEVFDIEDKHGCYNINDCGDFKHRDYCETHDCNYNHCRKHHHHDRHHHVDISEDINIHCHVHKCHRDKCRHRHHDVEISEEINVHCHIHNCHREHCKHRHHYEEHDDDRNCMRRIKEHKNKTFEIEFGNVLYVRNKNRQVCAIFGFTESGHLFYQKCMGITCEIVKLHRNIQISFS